MAAKSKEFVLAYGYFCRKDVVFPWDSYDCILDWWIDIHRYSDDFIKLTTRAWLDRYPIPILILNVDTKEYSDYFIAVRESVQYCNNKNILHFYPEKLVNFTCGEGLIDCVSFIHEYNIETTELYPRWNVIKARM